ncbi:MAG TPA: NAD(P)/FAD-dependent oxidoreductase [Thermoleophilaceae bacterium]|nr:NAD(P)/FAD-dependent oxidoreductase [Thermoleophilaceae bacterium]
MRTSTLSVDVAVVGASLAGCTTARLLAREGLTVALIEKHSDPNAYKRLCGHFILASATPVIRRLGLAEAIEAAGGVRNGVDFWTRWGWIEPRPEPGGEEAFGYSIRRSKLDPMIRRLAIETPGVTYLGGTAAVELLERDGRIAGVVGRDRRGSELSIRAPLVVAADGRNSAVAKLAGARARTRPNERFCYMAYFTGIERRPDNRGWFWTLERDVVIVAPNDGGITLVAMFPHKTHLAAFKAGREAAFEAMLESVPERPSLAQARRVSKLVGYTDYPIITRPPVPRRGLALVGDAALSMDPVFAVGCGWALQSASWVVDAAAPALGGSEPLDRALRRYAAEHRRRLRGHARVLSDGARAKEAPLPVRAMLAAAVRDPDTARRFEDFATRSIPVRRFLAPSALARAAVVNLRHRTGRTRGARDPIGAT